MTKYERILNVIEEMEDNDIVNLWNEYVWEVGNYDDEIFDYDRLEELIENSSESGMYWANRFFFGSDQFDEKGSANPNRNFFVFDGYGNIESFDYVYNKYAKEMGRGDGFYNVDVEDLINYILENEEDFGYSEIKDILEDEEDEEE